jgi:hypothetical protein
LSIGLGWAKRANARIECSAFACAGLETLAAQFDFTDEAGTVKGTTLIGIISVVISDRAVRVTCLHV